MLVVASRKWLCWNDPASYKPQSAHESHWRLAGRSRVEGTKVGEHGSQRAVRHAEPADEFCAIGVDLHAGDETALTGVDVSTNSERWIFAEDGSSFDGSTDDEMVAAPPVVGAATVGDEGAPEIRGGEKGDLIGEIELFHCSHKGGNGLTDFGKHLLLVLQDLVVVIPAEALDEKRLPFQTQRLSGTNGASDHVQVLAGGCVGENGFQRHGTNRGGECFVSSDSSVRGIDVGLLEETLVLLLKQIAHGSGFEGRGPLCRIEAFQADAAVGRDGIGENMVSILEEIVTS
jgi:hypothetical protein